MEEIKLFGPYRLISLEEAREQKLKRYFTGKPCKHGHITAYNTQSRSCHECGKRNLKRWRKNNSNYNKEWKKNNPEKVRESARKSSANNRAKNPEKVREQLRNFYSKNREMYAEKSRKFRKENPEKINEYTNKWRANNPEKAKVIARKSTKAWAERNPEISALKNRHHGRIHDLIKKGLLPKGGGYSRSIGCNANQFKAHIESQFVDGMNWDNFDQIAIDHVRPISSFSDLLNSKEQRKVCFNYRNTQPLWAKDNREKWANYTPLDELAWVERMQALGYEGELFLKYEEGNSY